MPAIYDKTIAALRGKERPYKFWIGDGLYLLVRNDLSKYWQMKYRYAGKSNVLSFGTYPLVSLADAKRKRDAARRLLANGIDPGAEKRARKNPVVTDAFQDVANDWHEKQCKQWVPSHADFVLNTLENDVFPYIGSKSIKSIEAPEILDLLRVVEARGAYDQARRIRQRISAVFRYGIVTGLCSTDPAAYLKGALTPPKFHNLPAITDLKSLKKLMRDIDGYIGRPLTRLGLLILAHVVVRPGELRLAVWEEFDFDEKLWRIPSSRMKMKREHVVPLTDTVISLLLELRNITKSDTLLFPGDHNRRVPMSENTLTYGLARMGYKGIATAHGFRSSFSTLANEAGFNSDWIEASLAHVSGGVRKAYMRSTYLEQRRELMAWWDEQIRV